VKNVHGVFHRALDKAARLGMIRMNPSEDCDLPKAEKKEIHPLEEKDISAFLQCIANHKYANVYWVTLFAGLRQGEVLGLTWDCIDFARNTILVNKQLQKTEKVGGEYILTSTKNDRSRVVTVAPSVMAVLKKQKNQQLQMQKLAQEAWDNLWNLVFTNDIGGHLCHITVYKHYKKLVAQMGMPEERFHDLRHSYAVVSLESGDDVKTVQGNLGHATASFTLDVYGHVSQRMRQRSAERMELFIRTIS
jgi:integrase